MKTREKKKGVSMLFEKLTDVLTNVKNQQIWKCSIKDYKIENIEYISSQLIGQGNKIIC